MSDHMILNAVVASDKTNGIGFTEAQYGNANVSLPWKLDGEFKYFMDVCTYNKVRDSSIINPRFIIHLFGKNGFLGCFKGSSDPSHFIFGINVGISRIRYRTTF